MTNVIALLRVSTEAQAGADRQGLPAQREACERIAAAHRVHIVEWVELDGVSGAAVLADPRFRGLLERLADPAIGGVVAAAFDRLFRPSRFADFAILDAFRDSGCRIFTASGVLDPASANDGLLGLITGHLAGQEREAIRRRTMAGRERKRRELGVRAEGDGRTSMPRGVIFDRATDPPEWRYEYPAAGQVRRAFDLFLSGETNLTEIGRRIGLGERKAFAVRSMLRQRLYAGVYRVDRRWLAGGRWVPRDPEDCYEHTVLSPPLVTPEEFARVQARLGEIAGARPKVPALEARPVDYAGFAYCARCGSRMMVLRQPRPARWVYRCARDKRGRTHRCDLGEFVSRKVDEAAGEAIGRGLSDADTVIRLVRKGIERGALAAPPAAELARRLTLLANRRARILDGYEAGDYELAEMRKRLAGVDAERNAIELQMEAAEGPEIDESACVDVAYAFARWGRLGRARRRRLLESFGIRLWVEKDGRGRRAAARVVRIEIGSLGNAVIYNESPS
jgi:DNA invertase Pin-like site-specific DNA recombinase